MTEDQAWNGYDPLEFTVRRFQLIALARWALAPIPANPTLPVNGCFRVTVRPEAPDQEALLELAAADQRMAVFARAPAVIAASAGEVFIPARKLEAILDEAAEGDVTVRVKGVTATVTAGSASWTLRLPSPDRYIGLPDLDAAQFAVTGREPLLAALATVKHAVGKDAGRPAFTQVALAEHGGVMCAHAADSSQYARARVPGFPAPLAVPAGVLDDLVKLLGKAPEDDIGIADAGPYVVFRVGPVTMAAVKMNSAFPSVETLTQGVKGNNQRLTVDKAELTAAIRRVRINADPGTSAIALIADDSPSPTLTVVAKDANDNSAEEAVPVEWEGGHQLLCVNAGFLEAMLAVHPGPTCEFMIGKDRGQQRLPLLLEDPETGTCGVCPQMVPRLMGY